MLKFLMDIAVQLIRMDIKGNVILNGRRMLSAIIVICCLHELTPKTIKHLSDIPSDLISALLSLLCLMPDLDRRKCADWNYLTTFIPDSLRKKVSDAILAFVVHLSHTKYFDLPDWLFAVPIVHFLRKITTPFQDLETNPKKISWGDRLIGLQGVKSFVNDRKDEVWYVFGGGYILSLNS